MRSGSFEKWATKLLPVTLPILGLLILVAGYQQVASFVSELGADPAFGKIRPTAIADLKGGREVGCTVESLKNEDFDRLSKVVEIEPRRIGLSKEYAIAESLGFTAAPKELKSPGGERKHVWQTSGKILEVVPKQGSINYADFEAIAERKIEDQTAANQIAQDFLQKDGLLFDLKNFETNTVRVERGKVLKTKRDFNGFEIIFSQKLDQYKIITPSLEGLASVVVGVDGKIKRLTYLMPAQVSKTASYPVKGKEEAIKLLVSGKVPISNLEIDGRDYLIGETYNFKMIKVIESSLVYVDDGQNQLLQPHYQFKGKVSLADGRRGTATFLANAIKDKYLER